MWFPLEMFLRFAKISVARRFLGERERERERVLSESLVSLVDFLFMFQDDGFDMQREISKINFNFVMSRCRFVIAISRHACQHFPSRSLRIDMQRVNSIFSYRVVDLSSQFLDMHFTSFFIAIAPHAVGRTNTTGDNDTTDDNDRPRQRRRQQTTNNNSRCSTRARS